MCKIGKPKKRKERKQTEEEARRKKEETGTAQQKDDRPSFNFALIYFNMCFSLYFKRDRNKFTKPLG